MKRDYCNNLVWDVCDHFNYTGLPLHLMQITVNCINQMYLKAFGLKESLRPDCKKLQNCHAVMVWPGDR